MSSVVARLRPIISPPTGKHTASLIFLHGSGDTGNNVKEWINMILPKAFTFPHIRVIYPTAPLRPYTPAMGMPSTVWFDRSQISPFVPEHQASVEDMCHSIKGLLELEVQRGIPYERIVLGGFSMGGAMALYYGYKYCHQLAGIFGLSSFLSEQCEVYEVLRRSQGILPPLFQCHGEKDPLVMEEWGRKTHDKLKSFGMDCSYHTYPNLFHEMNQSEITQLNEWTLKRLPEID